jgi:hypothetical protein
MNPVQSTTSYFFQIHFNVCEIRRFHADDYEEFRLLGCDAV